MLPIRKLGFALLTLSTLLACSKPNTAISQSTTNQRLEVRGSKCQFDFEKLRSSFRVGDVTQADLREDNNLVERLRKCPQEEVAGQILEFKKSHDDDLGFRSKTAYLLTRIGYERDKYANELIDTYGHWKDKRQKVTHDSNYNPEAEIRFETEEIGGEQLIALICEMIRTEDRDGSMLIRAHRLIDQTDGVSSTLLYSFYGQILESDPSRLLKSLTDVPNADLQLLISSFCVDLGRQRLFKILRKSRPSNPSVADKLIQLAMTSTACDQ